jgi:3-hydroxybutyryl-CoA dehydrogenase
MESSVCICGAGTMGRGIALAVAAEGFPVLLYDLNKEVLDDAKKTIEKELHQAEEKKRITANDRNKILQGITFIRSVEECRAPIIIEAIQEKPEFKSDLFLELSAVNTDETIYTTNTSSLSVTAIAEKTPFPERIVGLHFFNPANRMKLVEIVKTKYNPDNIIQRTLAFARRIGKTPVICQDSPGFIVNHVARPYYLEALRLAELGISDPDTIDKLMESAGFKMGPFHLMDLIGNDINYTVSSSLYEALDRPARLKPSGLQEGMLKKGALGKKTGEGFFQYAKPAAE